MSQNVPGQGSEVAAQREVARIALAGVDGFALAGSGAIREHGLIERPTEDVDLFTISQDVTMFSRVVDQITADLRDSGYQVEVTRRAAQFSTWTPSARRAGFDIGMFAQQLAAARRLQVAQVARYGVTAEQLEAVKGRCIRWATDLSGSAGPAAV